MKKLNIFKIVILVLCFAALIGLFLPYERSIGEYRQYLKDNPTQINIEEVNFKNEDVIDISIVENFKVYSYSINNNSGDNWLQGEAIINVIITITLIMSIALIILFTLLNKSVLIIFFSIIMGVSSLLMNYDIVDRGVIPSTRYTYGLTYYLYILLGIVIFGCSVANIIKNKNQKKNNINKKGVYMENNENNKKIDIKNDKNLMLKIAIGICLILIIVIVCLVFFMNKNNSSNNNSSNINNEGSLTNNNFTIQGKTLEELKINSTNDIASFTTELESEWKILSSQITTFDDYKNNKEKISKYYDKIVKNTETFSIKIREYALKYGEIIINSDKSFNDKYDELEEIYDDIYDGIAEDLYDDIYDGLLEDMYDYYYDGILDDAYDNVPYEDYSDMRSVEYKNYSKARSDIYDAYSDARADVYDFYSKLSSKIYEKKLDKAKEKLQDFSKDIEKLKNK